MATTQNFAEGPAAVVGINLTTAGHLADALARSAVELRSAAQSAHAVQIGLGAGGSAAAARLAAASGWAADEAAGLRALVQRLRALDGDPVVRWTGGLDPAFADPVAAHGQARLITQALREGSLDRAAALLAAHGDDPVVATVVVERLGAEGIVALLRPAVLQWGRSGEAYEDQRAVVLGVAEALARADRQGTTSVTVEDIALAADRATVPRSALALLFVGGAHFPAPFLRQAVTDVVAPINAVVRAEPGRGVDPWMIPAAGAPLDARVVVLDAVARNRRAAVDAVGSVDLDDLLGADLGYLDGGLALARLLRRATAPVDAAGLTVERPLVTTSPVTPGKAGENARRVIEWIGEHRHVPPAVQAELGHLARPWIGSFRTAGLDTVVRAHLTLDEALARSFLVYAQARDEVAEVLQEAAWTWGEAEVHRLSGPRFDGRGFDAVGSVLGIVTIAALDADAAAAESADRRTERRNELWRLTTRLAVGRLPPPLAALLDPVTRRAVDRVLPDADRTVEHWRDLRDLAVVHEYLALDHLVAATLWARRHENHVLSRPPRRLLRDPARPDRGLRHPLTFDEADVVAWTRWRSAQPARGPAPQQVAGDQFLADSRG